MNNSITKNKTTFTTQNLVLMALFAAVLCVSAYISIPLPNGSHITALNFVVTLIGLVFAVEQSFFISLVWLLHGLSCGAGGAFQGRRPSGLSKRPSLFPDPFLDHGGAGRYGSGGRPGDFPFLFRQAGAAGKIQRVFRLFRYF